MKVKRSTLCEGLDRIYSTVKKTEEVWKWTSNKKVNSERLEQFLGGHTLYPRDEVTFEPNGIAG